MTSKNHNNKDITEAEIFQFQCDRTIDRHLCRIDTTDATIRAEMGTLTWLSISVSVIVGDCGFNTVRFGLFAYHSQAHQWCFVRARLPHLFSFLCCAFLFCLWSFCILCLILSVYLGCQFLVVPPGFSSVSLCFGANLYYSIASDILYSPRGLYSFLIY